MTGLIIFSVVAPLLSLALETRAYALSGDARHLVGATNSNLTPKLAYDAKQKAWLFNNLEKPLNSSDAESLFHNQIGGGGTGDTTLYSATLPADASKGITYTDNASNISFTLKPQFSKGQGKLIDNRLIYPMAHDAKAVYTLKANGLKEDIILSHEIGDELNYSYTLDLPEELEARVQDDGTVGIYSISPLLLNAKTSSDTDTEKLRSARESAAKNYLAFGLPAPVIIDKSGKRVPGSFSLAGNTLTVHARGLATLSYPLTIDPSVVITSSADFAAGNNEENISFDTDQISRETISGGMLASNWASTATGSYTARIGAGSASYNGYMYYVGGTNGAAMTEVNYTPINSDGTIGAWNTTTALPAARTYAAAVPYNGKLYVYGGYTSGTSALNSVIYATINSNGTLGSWTSASTSMATATCRFGWTAYKGYLYAAGGATGTIASGCGNSSATMTNTLQYAPILASGDLGAWTTSANTFTSARKDVGLAIYNDFVYISSGTTDGITTYTDTQISKIGTNGDIGAWRTSSQTIPTNGKYRFGYRAYNGYLYLAGGTNNLTGMLYAQIYANGDIGSWASSGTMSTGRYGLGFVLYKGYVYYIGGNDGANYLNDTGYAKFSDAGIATAFGTSGNTFTTTRRGAQTLVSGNYLYVLGGDNGAGPNNTVYKALISSNGSIGTFSSTTAFTTARTYFAAVAYGGYMYVLGGCTSAYSACGTNTNNITTVYRSTINQSDGTLGAWSADGSITTARYGLTAVAYNGYMYVMGGLNGTTFNNTIQYHAITPTTGAMAGAWTTSAKTLPASSAYVSATVYGGVLYVAGGCSAGALTCTTTRNTVHYASLATSGDLSATLASTSAFTTARGDFGLVAIKGRLYITGGRTNTTYYNDVQSAPINTNGTIGTWVSLSATLSNARYGIGMVPAFGSIYVTGGYNGTTYYNDVQIAGINNGGSGIIGTQVTDSTDTIPTAREESQIITYNGYLYSLGGIATGNSRSNAVYYAPLNTDGSVGSWTTTTSFATSRNVFGATAMNGYMYIIGGSTGTPNLKDIQYAKINSDGSLDTWASAGSNVSNGGQGVCATSYNGYIYSLGGWDGSTDYNTVRYAAQNANGTIGSWQTANSFTTGRSNLNCIAYGGYLYLSGGEDTAGRNDVQYALINSNGSLGTWAATTSYQAGRANHAMFAANGFMYIAGGIDSTTNNAPRDDMQYAPINANGTVGEWALISKGNFPQRSADAVVYNGIIYSPTQNTVTGTTDTWPLFTSARKATYSKLIDTGILGRIIGISYGGLLTDGVLQISYRTAENDGVFGDLKNTQYPSLADACTGAYGNARYIWLSVSLDDTMIGTFSDSKFGAITDVTVNYSLLHPDVDYRLNGGKTLISGTLSALDTCG